MVTLVLSDEQLVDLARVVSVGGMLAAYIAVEPDSVIDRYRSSRTVLRKTRASAERLTEMLSPEMDKINLKMARAN